MTIRLLCVGKVRDSAVASLLAEYAKRLRAYFPLEELEVRPADGSDALRATRDESERILKQLEASDVVWLVEREGVQLSSKDLSARLGAVANSGLTKLTLVICGPYGANSDLRQRANFQWSLSSLTFLHEWARAIVVEQLYRAAKIARNEPYHH